MRITLDEGHDGIYMRRGLVPKVTRWCTLMKVTRSLFVGETKSHTFNKDESTCDLCLTCSGLWEILLDHSMCVLLDKIAA